MTDQSNSGDTLGSTTHEFRDDGTGGAYLDLDEDVADILDLDTETEVQVNIVASESGEVELTVDIPGVDLTEDQREALIAALND